MKGHKGARVSVLAVHPYGGTGYTTARLQVVAYDNWNPKTPEEAMQAWWEHKTLDQSTVRSDLARRLPASGDHVQKLVNECVHRAKVNILLMPYDIDALPNKAMRQFLYKVGKEVQQDPAWQTHQRWLLPSITGISVDVGTAGVLRIDGVGKSKDGGGKSKRVVQTGELDRDVVWGMIQAWLNQVLPITGLRSWFTRDEYLHRLKQKGSKS